MIIFFTVTWNAGVKAAITRNVITLPDNYIVFPRHPARIGKHKAQTV